MTYRISSSNGNLTQFIRSKYEYKKFASKGPPPAFVDQSEVVRQCEDAIYGESRVSSSRKPESAKIKSKSLVQVPLTSPAKPNAATERPKSEAPEQSNFDFLGKTTASEPPKPAPVQEKKSNLDELLDWGCFALKLKSKF